MTEESDEKPLKSILRREPNRERRWPKGSKVVRIQEGPPTGEYFHTSKAGTAYQQPDTNLHSEEDSHLILKENNNIHDKVKFSQ